MADVKDSVLRRIITQIREAEEKLKELKANYEKVRDLPEDIFDFILHSGNGTVIVGQVKTTAPSVLPTAPVQPEKKEDTAVVGFRAVIIDIIRHFNRPVTKREIVNEFRKKVKTASKNAVTYALSDLKNGDIVRRYVPSGNESSRLGGYWTLTEWWLNDHELKPEYATKKLTLLY